MGSVGGAAAAAVTAAAGAHALAWYLGLLALLLVFESVVWPALRRRRSTGDASLWWRRGARALPVVCIGLIIAAAAIFAGVAYVTRNGAFAQADQVFLDAMRASVPAQAIKLFAWVTWFGDAHTLALVCIAAAAVLLACGKTALAFGTMAAVAGNGLLNTVMKRAFEHSCPRHGIDLLFGHHSCFPSGHTSGAVVAYGMLAYVLVRTLPSRWHSPVLLSATALIFSVGCSRIFVQAHFPSDVLAGFASGIAWLALVVLCTESWLRGWRPGGRLDGPGGQATPAG